MREHIDTIPVWDSFRMGGECPLCDLRHKTETGYLEYFLGASVMEPAERVEVNKNGFCTHHFAQMFAMQNRLGLALMVHTHLKTRIPNIKPKKKAEKTAQSCILCDRLANTMARYFYTTFYLWQHDKAFRKVFSESKGFCLPHYTELMDIGNKNEVFTNELFHVEQENLNRLEQELEWFTLKFDYRNQDKPWGNSKDALERTIHKLVGT